VLALVPESLDNLVSTNEAADACGVECATVRSWVARGHLTATGLDERNRPLYKLIDVLRASRDTRRRATGGRRTA
jgi:DNA-binding transcriptional MerR regulator